ncbi:MAG: hypothetical protein Q4A87_01565 [Streptococcus sp.]|nr:hypothetical protein [Streptococcus sp.]
MNIQDNTIFLQKKTKILFPVWLQEDLDFFEELIPPVAVCSLFQVF